MTHSAVIVTRDRAAEIESALRGLLAQSSVPDEIIVVDASDDRATDEPPERSAAAADQRIRHITSEAGISRQRNIGLDASRGDLVSFFDDDVLLDAQYLRVVLDRFAADTESLIGGIGGLMTNPPRRSALETAFRKLFLIQTDKGLNRFRSSGIPDPGYAFKDESEVEVLATTAVTYRRSAIADIRFDEHRLGGAAFGFTSGRCFGEDMLFSSMVGERHRLLILPAARFEHHPSPANREEVFTMQTLYITALRLLSAPRKRNAAARQWAMAGLFILSVLQTLRYGDVGYMRGYFASLRRTRGA